MIHGEQHGQVHAISHLHSKWATEGRGKGSWSGPAKGSLLHYPRTFTHHHSYFSSVPGLPRHEIQPLTWSLQQTGMGKSGPALPGQGLVPGGHFSRFPMKRNSWSIRCTREVPRPLLFSAGSPVGSASPHGACRKSQCHLFLQQVRKVLLARIYSSVTYDPEYVPIMRVHGAHGKSRRNTILTAQTVLANAVCALCRNYPHTPLHLFNP